MAYRYADKQKTLSIGVYPTVSLAQARKHREKARELLSQGSDPGQTKRTEKIAARAATTSTFEAVAREFHAQQSGGWSAGSVQLNGFGSAF